MMTNVEQLTFVLQEAIQQAIRKWFDGAAVMTDAKDYPAEAAVLTTDGGADKAAVLVEAKKLFGAKAHVWEDEDIKRIGADRSIYREEKLKETAWKNATYDGHKVCWGYGTTWEGAVKNGRWPRKLDAHAQALKLN